MRSVNPVGACAPMLACSNRPQPSAPSQTTRARRGRCCRTGCAAPLPGSVRSTDRLGPVLALPLAVRPVGVAVAGAELQRHEPEGVDLDRHRLPGHVGEVQRGVLRVTAARAVADVVLRPAELLDPAVGPHPLGVVERAVPVGLLLHDHDDLEVVEAQRHVEPPEAAAACRVSSAMRPGPSASPTGRMPHERSRLPSQVDGSTAIVCAAGAHLTRPRSHLREARALEDGAVAVVDDVRLLLDRRERALPT